MLLNPYNDLKSWCLCLAHQGGSARSWLKLYLNLKAVIVRKARFSHYERNGYEFLTPLRNTGHNPVSNIWSLLCILNRKAQRVASHY